VGEPHRGQNNICMSVLGPSVSFVFVQVIAAGCLTQKKTHFGGRLGGKSRA
jgi:hypothetical protein